MKKYDQNREVPEYERVNVIYVRIEKNPILNVTGVKERELNKTTFNHDHGHWDYYSIGGRWDGSICGITWKEEKAPLWIG